MRAHGRKVIGIRPLRYGSMRVRERGSMRESNPKAQAHTANKYCIQQFLNVAGRLIEGTSTVP